MVALGPRSPLSGWLLTVRHAIHLERVVQFEDCGAGGVGRGEGNLRGRFEGVVGRIELGIDYVAVILIVDRSAAERCGPAITTSSDRIRTLAWEQSFIGVIQRAMVKPKQIATAAAALRGSVATQSGRHALWQSALSPSLLTSSLLTSSNAQPRASLTALLHELPRFRAAGAAAPPLWMR